MSYDTLQVWRKGPVGWLVFDRPTVGNAADATMFEELPLAWAALDADPAVRVIVNTGNGRAFQTGLDVVQLARDPGALKEQSRRTRDATLRMTAQHNRIWKPVIAAVNGSCVGGGLHFVADADVVIASGDARFSDPHVSVGQVSAFETIGLLHKVAAGAVFRLALTGRHEVLDAVAAYRLGLVSQVVEPPDQLRRVAQELGERMARTPPSVLRAAKQAMWAAFEHRGGQPSVTP